MKLTYKYGSNLSMRKTNDFELIIDKNLERIRIIKDQIEFIESFEYISETLYPEQVQFSKYHPCGDSFGVHFKLKNGRDAWIYGRVSNDYNVNKIMGKVGNLTGTLIFKLSLLTGNI